MPRVKKGKQIIARHKRSGRRIGELEIKGLPQAISAATPPELLSYLLSKVDVRPSRRKGPAPGKLDRYGEADRALFPQLEQVMKDKRLSASAAARRLADDDKVAGTGTPLSRARRLTKRFLADLH